MAQRILVVDDEPEILEMTAAMLGRKGYEVATATNGMLALAEIKKKKPHLILADVLMPEMDGFVLYKQLKADALTADIPVLIITGRGKMEDSFKVMGVDGFIAKPFSPEDLLAEIEQLLALDKMGREMKAQSQKKVMIIGSKEMATPRIVNLIHQAGFELEVVASGADAIARAVKILPHIIFIDVQLPDMAAWELTDILRRLPQTQGKPIIGFCYYSTDRLNDPKIRMAILQIHENSRRLLQCGATEYIGKYTEPLFITTLTKYLTGKKNEQA